MLDPAPFVVAEVGGYFAPEEILPAEIDGDGDGFEALMPLVWMPGGMGRLTLVETVLAAVAEGAILEAPRSADQSAHTSATKPGSCYIIGSFDLVCPSNAAAVICSVARSKSGRGNVKAPRALGAQWYGVPDMVNRVSLMR